LKGGAFANPLLFLWPVLIDKFRAAFQTPRAVTAQAVDERKDAPFEESQKRLDVQSIDCTYGAVEVLRCEQHWPLKVRNPIRSNPTGSSKED
jgi:hypothetical protein